MGKPLGIRVGLSERGAPRMYVPPISRAEDAIWEAVDEAIMAGMSPQQFKREAAQAWEHELSKQAEAARKEILK